MRIFKFGRTECRNYHTFLEKKKNDDITHTLIYIRILNFKVDRPFQRNTYLLQIRINLPLCQTRLTLLNAKGRVKCFICNLSSILSRYFQKKCDT